MIRQTGGTAVGEISTRSSAFPRAIASACGGGMMPNCCPVVVDDTDLAHANALIGADAVVTTTRSVAIECDS